MPTAQVAAVSTYDFGAPAAIGTVLSFRTKVNEGGKLDLKFTNDNGDANITVSVEVSPDGTTWAATSVANNLSVITSVVVKRKTSNEYVLLIRPGTDNYMRVRALGSARGGLQIRGNKILEIVQV